MSSPADYLGRGWSVFPLPRASKRANTPWARYQHRRMGADQVDRAFGGAQNVAVVTGAISGLIVVDVDTKSEAPPAWLPATGMVARTGSGGWHFLYRHPGDQRYRNMTRAKLPAPHGERWVCDVRADGGYIAAPPSLHPSGGQYTWYLDEGWLGDPPEWALEPDHDKTPPPKPPKADMPAAQRYLAAIAGASEGNGGDVQTFKAAAVGRDFGVPESEWYDVLLERYNPRCDPPWDPAELREKVHNAYRYARGKADKEQQKPAVLEFRSMRDYCLQHHGEETEWLIDQWLPAASITLVVAPPQTYKSWLAQSAMLAVARPQPFLGTTMPSGGRGPDGEPHDPHPRPVLYLPQEDGHPGVASRLMTTWEHGGGWGRLQFEGTTTMVPPWEATPNILVHEDRAFTIDDPKMMDALEEQVSAIQPALIVIDPLYAITSKTDDHMASAAKQLLRLKTLRDRYGTGIMFVHHAKKSAATWSRENMWGSQLLSAYFETVWQVRPTKVDQPEGVVVHRHTKDAESPGFAFVRVFDEGHYNPSWRQLENETEANELVGTE